MRTITKDVICSFANGDGRAFDKIFKAYNRNLQIFINKIIHSPEDSKELAQEVFIKLWESRHMLDHEQNVNSYIFQTAKNLALNYIRHKKVHERFISETIYTQSDEVTTINNQIYAEYTKLLDEIVSDVLPSRQKTILSMSNKGYTNEEIAAEMNISKRTVDNNLSLIKATIKKIILIAIILLDAQQNTL